MTSDSDKKHEEWVLTQVGLPHMVAATALYSTGGPMLKEFKEFAMRGNVLDMAVGIVIGASFGRIITSFVDDILMPPIGLLLGRMDFSNLFLNLSGQYYDSLAAAKSLAPPRSTMASSSTPSSTSSSSPSPSFFSFAK